jgi:30S ribosomal protein S31
MGKGDKKSRKGKIVMGSYGNLRKRKAKKQVLVSSVTKEKKLKKAMSETPSADAKEAKTTVKKKKVKETEVKTE